MAEQRIRPSTYLKQDGCGLQHQHPDHSSGSAQPPTPSRLAPRISGTEQVVLRALRNQKCFAVPKRWEEAEDGGEQMCDTRMNQDRGLGLQDMNGDKDEGRSGRNEKQPEEEDQEGEEVACEMEGLMEAKKDKQPEKQNQEREEAAGGMEVDREDGNEEQQGGQGPERSQVHVAAPPRVLPIVPVFWRNSAQCFYRFQVEADGRARGEAPLSIASAQACASLGYSSITGRHVTDALVLVMGYDPRPITRAEVEPFISHMQRNNLLGSMNVVTVVRTLWFKTPVTMTTGPSGLVVDRADLDRILAMVVASTTRATSGSSDGASSTITEGPSQDPWQSG